ncbi:hypothetical protein D1007_06693 [Hordeum vulgare]|nr:hypothetical protein D1007_06693 [Hordeum vulgare]
MTEGLSHKRPGNELSEHATKHQDDIVPGEKLDYTKELKVVDALGEKTLYVLCTSNLEVANEMINKVRLNIGGMRDRNVNTEVEYSKEDYPNQRAAVLRLCLEEQVLVYHITTSIEM